MDYMQMLIIFCAIMGCILGVIVPFQIQTNSRIDAIHQEMKDFHGRLCSIEREKIK